MKKTGLHLYVIIFLSFSLSTAAQQQEEVKSIKVKRESVFAKAAFNESEYKVIAFDRFGNPHEQAIKSFSIYYKDGKNTYEAPVIGNQFPDKTIQFLTKKKATATKICLTKLKAEDKEGHLEDLPDLCDIVIFPDCKKVNKSK